MTENSDTLVLGDRVAGRLYTDPEIFEAELTKIFERTWVWGAHESELPGPGTFKRAYVGRRPVIVTRDRKGVLHTLLNRCRHRGASLCERPNGRANGFTCPYHTWSYGLDGTLRGVPYPEGYEGVLDKRELSLKRPRTEAYGGMVFATFGDAIEPLAESLGDARLWIDRFMKQGGGYPIKVLGRHRFRFRATGRSSWRTPATATTSRSCTDPGWPRSTPRPPT